MDPDPNPGGPKTCGSGSGSATLVIRVHIGNKGTEERENREANA